MWLLGNTKPSPSIIQELSPSRWLTKECLIKHRQNTSIFLCNILNELSKQGHSLTFNGKEIAPIGKPANEVKMPFKMELGESKCEGKGNSASLKIILTFCRTGSQEPSKELYVILHWYFGQINREVKFWILDLEISFKMNPIIIHCNNWK